MVKTSTPALLTNTVGLITHQCRNLNLRLGAEADGPTCCRHCAADLVARERAALQVFFDATGGKKGWTWRKKARWQRYDGWRTSKPLESWHGVRIHTSGRVDVLELSWNNLSGTHVASAARDAACCCRAPGTAVVYKHKKWGTAHEDGATLSCQMRSYYKIKLRVQMAEWSPTA